MIFLMSFLRMRRYSYFIKYLAATSCFQIIQLFSVPVTWKLEIFWLCMSGICFAIIHLSLAEICKISKVSGNDQSEKPYFSMTSLTSRRIRGSYIPFLARWELGFETFQNKKCRPSKTYPNPTVEICVV